MLVFFYNPSTWKMEPGDQELGASLDTFNLYTKFMFLRNTVVIKYIYSLKCLLDS